MDFSKLLQNQNCILWNICQLYSITIPFMFTLYVHLPVLTLYFKNGEPGVSVQKEM